MRRITAVIVAMMAAAALALSGCASPRVTTPEQPDIPTVGYVRLPDGRVLECVKSQLAFGYRQYDCDWQHPYSTNGSAPTDADVRIVDHLEYIQWRGEARECFQVQSSYEYRTKSCNFSSPVQG